MKMKFIYATLLLATLAVAVSCSKEKSLVAKKTEGPVDTPSQDPAASRTVRFQLYTNEDFSGDNHTIRFSAFIKDGQTHLFDTTLAPMLVKDVPDAANKIVFEKTVSAGVQKDLSVGFVYQIDGVGVSWTIDTSKAGNPLKVLDFNFR